MPLNTRDYTIIKGVQATHNQGDVRYGWYRGIQCSCLFLLSLSWALFKYPGLLDKFDVDCMLRKGDQLFKLIGKFRYLWMEDLPQEFLIENSWVNMGFLENKTRIITAREHLLSIAEIVSNIQQMMTGTAVIFNNYILGLFWGIGSIYLVDLHSKD